MAIKKDMKAWAIKIRGRSFYQNPDGYPYLYKTHSIALSEAIRIGILNGAPTKPVRVKVRIEEIE